MLVTGGRFGWARVVTSGALSLAALALISTAACGSRTSMLDPNAYDTSAGGSGMLPIGQAGKSSVGSAGRPNGIGGATTTPTAGAGSGATGGVDATTAATCNEYCPRYGTQCKKRLRGQDCVPTCQGELTNYGPTCHDLGVSALRCLTPFFTAQGGNCDAAVTSALAQCDMIVDAFEACKKNFSAGTATSSNNVASCSRVTGPDNSGSCTEIFNCPNGPFVTFCTPSAASMQLECGCAPPSGAVPTKTVPFTADPCLAATKLCP